MDECNQVAEAEIAIRRENVDALKRILSECPRTVNAKTARGSNLVHVAAALGQNDCALALLCHGALVDATDCIRRTPITYAAMYCSGDVVTAMANRGANINDVFEGNDDRFGYGDNQVFSCLDAAVAMRNSSAVRALLELGAMSRAQKLDTVRIALFNVDPDCLELLLVLGQESVPVTDSTGRGTCRDMVRECFMWSGTPANMNRLERFVQVLLEYGIPVDAFSGFLASSPVLGSKAYYDARVARGESPPDWRVYPSLKPWKAENMTRASRCCILM